MLGRYGEKRMDKVKISEILERLKKEGIDLPKRTFEFWQRLGLLPKPEKHVGRGGRGVYGYYDPAVVDLVKLICKLKEKGYSLFEITEKTNAIIIKKYKRTLKDWGFSDYILSEMKGFPPSISKEIDEQLRDHYRQDLEKKGLFVGDQEVEEAFIELQMPDHIFEQRLLEELKWYHPDEVIEAKVLEQISNEAEATITGLNSASGITAEELALYKNKGTRKAIKGILDKLMGKTMELQILYSKVNGRLAEIHGGNYKERSKEQWEARAEIFKDQKPRWEELIKNS